MSENKKKFAEMISSLEGYHQALKSIHWTTKSNATHLLSDEIDEGVLSFEDEFAEFTMGILGVSYSLADFKTLLPSSRELGEVLSEMKGDVEELRAYVDGSKGYSGLVSLLDDFMGKIDKWKFRSTLK